MELDAYRRCLEREGHIKGQKKNAVQKLRKEVKQAKRILKYLSSDTNIEIENFNDGKDFIQSLTRSKFEELHN